MRITNKLHPWLIIENLIWFDESYCVFVCMNLIRTERVVRAWLLDICSMDMYAREFKTPQRYKVLCTRECDRVLYLLPCLALWLWVSLHFLPLDLLSCLSLRLAAAVHHPTCFYSPAMTTTDDDHAAMRRGCKWAEVLWMRNRSRFGLSVTACKPCRRTRADKRFPATPFWILYRYCKNNESQLTVT